MIGINIEFYINKEIKLYVFSVQQRRDVMNELIAALVGGLLAAGTGWYFERRREAYRISKAKKFFTRAICDDLQGSLSLYDKIAEEWEKQKLFGFQL